MQILDFHIWELSFQYTATLCRRGRAPGGGGGAHFLKSTIEERDILELIHFTYHSYENICIEMLNVCNTIAQPFLTNYKFALLWGEAQKKIAYSYPKVT